MWPNVVSDEICKQWHEEGYFVLPRVVAEPELEVLRQQCDRFLAEQQSLMFAEGRQVHGLNHRASRYFLPFCSVRSDAIRKFAHSLLLSGIARSLLGEQAYLFLDQFVVKEAERGGRFSWHQDSGYIDHQHAPYLSCWIPLDDVDEENGTVYLLPYSRAGTRDVLHHRIDPESNDRIGYEGPDPGVPVIAPAGSIACFSSRVLHRSGQNASAGLRRVLLLQYSPEIIFTDDGAAPRHLAEPVVLNGRRVAHNVSHAPA
ncbi:MAG TPA: phytanoyl-CoA dioxygenase family protein [Polyangiaceae bacterium]|nr:phytanoyl-CoA dioxygenase family protein [Polyangiaceae bacterium]